MAQPDMDAKGMECLRGESLKRKHDESIQDGDEAIQTACKKVHLDENEEVECKANTTVAEEELKTAQPGMCEQNMEVAAGSSKRKRDQPAQDEGDSSCKLLRLDVDEEVEREANTAVAEEEEWMAVQPGMDEQNVEDATGSSWNCTRHETTQEDEASCK